jgi:transglutaminase-like putative cysteine protease
MKKAVYVPHYAPAEAKAKDLCKGVRSLSERYEIITKYVSNKIAYDYIRAITIPKRGGLPDVERCWKLHMGICLDIASLTVGMLRAVSIPACLVIGWADGRYHAWVEARINGTKYLYDHDDLNGRIKSYKKERLY